jgi:hypothetical protein
MKLLPLTCLLSFVGSLCVIAQPQGFSKTKLDSLIKKLATLSNDTNRINTLSLAYDIVTKGHGGTLDVRTQENEGTEFVIRLV